MSETTTATTILDHGYVPQEHAPDPVLGHGDPTAPGKIAIWLFLASEIMFFVAILGTYIVLRSGSPGLFARHAEVLSKVAAGTNTIVLIFSSLTMALAVDASQKGDRGRTIRFLSLTLLCAFGFMGIKAYEYIDKAHHHTLTARDTSSATGIAVYDGHVHAKGDDLEIKGYRMEMPAEGNFSIHLISEADIRARTGAKKAETFTVRKSDVTNDVTYGPWKSIFYSCYFTLTGVHGIHVLGGMVPLGLLLIQAGRGKLFPAHTENVGLYWHFVDLVWIFLFPLLYLI